MDRTLREAELRSCADNALESIGFGKKENDPMEGVSSHSKPISKYQFHR